MPAATGPQSIADALSLAGVVSHLHAALAAGTTAPSADKNSPELAAAKAGTSIAGAAAANFATAEDGASARSANCLVLPPEEEGEPAERAVGMPFSAAPSIYDSRAHLLHGVLHQNGFGHLLRVNGENVGCSLPGWSPLCKWHCMSLPHRNCAPSSHMRGPNVAVSGFELTSGHPSVSHVQGWRVAHRLCQGGS